MITKRIRSTTYLLYPSLKSFYYLAYSLKQNLSLIGESIILCCHVLGRPSPNEYYMFNWIFTLMTRYIEKIETGLSKIANLHNGKQHNGTLPPVFQLVRFLNLITSNRIRKMNDDDMHIFKTIIFCTNILQKYGWSWWTPEFSYQTAWKVTTWSHRNLPSKPPGMTAKLVSAGPAGGKNVTCAFYTLHI